VAAPVISARDVSKTFRVDQERRHTLKERVLQRSTRYQTFQDSTTSLLPPRAENFSG
jgi:hypothetical protein